MTTRSGDWKAILSIKRAIFVVLASCVSGVLSEARATTLDAATASLLDAPNVEIAEGDDGLKTLNVTLTLKYSPHAGETVDYELRPGSASANEDYLPLQPGTLRFEEGERTKTISVQIVGDRRAECDEWFVVRLTHWFRGEPLDVVAVIKNDDGPSPAGCTDGADGPDASVSDGGTRSSEKKSGASGCAISGTRREQPSAPLVLAGAALLATLRRRSREDRAG